MNIRIRTRHVSIMTLAVLLVALSIVAASAADQILEFKAVSMTTAMDKNGNAYTRFIVEKQTTLNGHSYTYGIPVMAFGELHAKAQAIEDGAMVKAIVNHRIMNDGRESYTVRAFLE